VKAGKLVSDVVLWKKVKQGGDEIEVQELSVRLRGTKE
jgi:hypothetical protein